MNAFGELLKEARVRSKLTQLDLSKKIIKPQATISAWETGRQAPDPDDASLPVLEKVLGVTLEEIKQAIRRQSAESDQKHNSFGISDADFFNYLKSEIDKIDEIDSEADIWLIGTEALPIFDESMQSRWADVLSNKASLHFVLFTDLMPKETTENALLFLISLLKNIRASRKNVLHLHPLFLGKEKRHPLREYAPLLSYLSNDSRFCVYELPEKKETDEKKRKRNRQRN